MSHPMYVRLLYQAAKEALEVFTELGPELNGHLMLEENTIMSLKEAVEKYESMTRRRRGD